MESSERAGVVKKVAVRLIAAWILLPAFFLGTGGTLFWWEAWVFCAILLIPMTAFSIWMARHDPASIERRLKVRETEAAQRHIQAWGGVMFFAVLIIPGIDHRLGWSHPPIVAELVAMAIALISYIAVLRVFVANRWAGRTVETYADQKVVSTGPYAIVRHPMYAAVVSLTLATPVALGSWWALLPVLAVVPMLALRIGNEEDVLIRELPGYVEYRSQVRWRLIPYVW